MKTLAFIILSAVGWMFVAVFFEAVYGYMKTQRSLPLAKAQLASVYWGLLGLIAFVTNGLAWVLNVPVALPIALSHIQLCRTQDAAISPRQVIQHMAVIARQFINSALARLNRAKP